MILKMFSALLPMNLKSCKTDLNDLYINQSFNKYLSICYVLDIVQGIGIIVGCKIDPIPAIMELLFPDRGTVD